MFVPQLHSVGWVIFIFSLAFFGQQSWSTLVMILPTDMISQRAVGTLAGLVGFGGAMGGVLLGQIVGWLRDYGYSLSLIHISESLGDFENISVTNCQIRDTGMAGIALYSADGAQMHNVTLDGITMDGVTVPVCVRLGARLKIFRAGDQPKPPGSLRDVNIKNVRVTGDVYKRQFSSCATAKWFGHIQFPSKMPAARCRNLATRRCFPMATSFFAAKSARAKSHRTKKSSGTWMRPKARKFIPSNRSALTACLSRKTAIRES